MIAKKLERLRRPLIAATAIAALLQWAVVLERSWAAVWAWYKFFGHGGGGHIVVGQTTQVVFILGSAVVAGIGYLLFKAESKITDSGIWKRLARFAWSSVTVCILFWIVLLVSPLVRFWPD